MPGATSGATLMLAALLCLAGCQAQTEAPGTPDSAEDEAAIRAVLDGIAADFSAGRIEEMFSYYQDDVLVSAPGAPEIIGKQAWRESLDASLPKDVDMGLVFNTAELEISGDLAYERGTYAIRIGDPATPAQSMTIEGRHIHIFKRQPDGSWKGWRLMENSADPATSPIPTAPAPAPAPAAGG
jgi:ketosteroid isomerase-like protein